MERSNELVEYDFNQRPKLKKLKSKQPQVNIVIYYQPTPHRDVLLPARTVNDDGMSTAVAMVWVAAIGMFGSIVVALINALLVNPN